MLDRKTVKPVLVYWHCCTYWPLELGPSCPMEHDTPTYDDRSRRGRKRRVWICEHSDAENSIAYLSRKAFLEHNEEYC